MNARKLVYSDIAKTGISMEYEHPKLGFIPFTARPDDVEDIGRELYAKAIAGDFGAISLYGSDFVFSERLEKKKAEIYNAFVDEFKVRTFQSVTAGILLDNRRWNEKNDMQNLTSQIKKGVYPFNWKGKNEIFSVTSLAIAEAIELEMILDAESIYFHKWNLESQIKTIEDDQALTTPTMTEAEAITAIEAMAW